MLFVIDRQALQRIIAIVRDDRTASTQGKNAPFLRLEADGNELTVAGLDAEATIPATVYESGVLFLRPTLFRRMLALFTGERHFTIQVTESELLMGNVRLPFQAADMRLFANPRQAPPNWPIGDAEAADWTLRRDYKWAIDIIRHYFSAGLDNICDDRFLRLRYERFQIRRDPIYSHLLNGMQDEALARTFVSYWTVAHTMATDSRFWLEAAVAAILVHKYREIEGSTTDRFVLNRRMLSEGRLRSPIPVAEMGEEHLEHASHPRVWREVLDADALRTIDVLVGEQEQMDAESLRPLHDVGDRTHLARIAESFKGRRVSAVNLQCNLIVIEPYRLDDQPHAWAFRFINPKSFSSHAQRKQERVNMLRLYALLVQEKILRDPKSIHVCVAELVPRSVQFSQYDRYPGYFSDDTYWHSDRLWEFIGVPFEAVTLAIRDAAKLFRQRLTDGLRGLLPHAKEQPIPEGYLFPMVPPNA